jgi:hypothetical protein
MEAKLEDLCAEVATMREGAERTAFLRGHRELLDSCLVEELAEAVRCGVRVDLPKASRFAEAAVAIAGELGEEEALGRALRAKGNALWFTGNCRDAVDSFRRAALLFERVGNRHEVGRTLSSSIQSLALLGEYDAAFHAASRAR